MQWVVICPTMHAQFVGLNSLICSYADGEKSCSDTSLELGLCVDGKHDWNEPKLPSCFPFASLLCRRCNTQGVFSQGFKCRLDYFLLSKSFPLVKKKKKKIFWGRKMLSEARFSISSMSQTNVSQNVWYCVSKELITAEELHFSNSVLFKYVLASVLGMTLTSWALSSRQFTTYLTWAA